MHPDSDAARSIRAEQNEAARPTQKEAAEMERERRAKEGCRRCGEDDPDVLQPLMQPVPECKGYQAPPDPRILLCESCLQDPGAPTARSEGLDRVRDRAGVTRGGKTVVGAAVYECDHVEAIEEPPVPTQTEREQVGRDDDGEPIFEEVEVEDPRGSPPPEITAQCKYCESWLDEVVPFDVEVAESDE